MVVRIKSPVRIEEPKGIKPWPRSTTKPPIQSRALRFLDTIGNGEDRESISDHEVSNQFLPDSEILEPSQPSQIMRDTSAKAFNKKISMREFQREKKKQELNQLYKNYQEELIANLINEAKEELNQKPVNVMLFDNLELSEVINED